MRQFDTGRATRQFFADIHGSVGFLAVLGLFLATIVNAVPQARPVSPNPETSIPMPNDPVELMKVARRSDGISAADSQPWHLKATYQVFASDGKKSEEGVYEVFFANSRKFKQSYASKSFSQVDYTTETGLFRTGDMQWPSGPERLVVRKLFHPFPNEEFLQKQTPQAFDRNMNGVNFRCVIFRSSASGGQPSESIVPTFCFDRDKPILRYTSGWGATYSELSGASILNGIFVFRDRYIARDISVSIFDKPYVQIHIDVLEDLTEAKDADFQPPATAVRAPPPMPFVPENLMNGRIIKRVEPGYAALANPGGWDGRVIADVIVGSDGHVMKVRPLSGSSMYQGMVADAIYKWVYSPFLVGTVPTEVETEVTYTFKPKK
jgi:Gram-negative bacterial TonB protein C-terminal